MKGSIAKPRRITVKNMASSGLDSYKQTGFTGLIGIFMIVLLENEPQADKRKKQDKTKNDGHN